MTSHRNRYKVISRDYTARRLRCYKPRSNVRLAFIYVNIRQNMKCHGFRFPNYCVTRPTKLG